MNESFAQQTVAVFGANGTVGGACLLLAASLGANIVMVAHKEMTKMQAYAQDLELRYQIKVAVVDGTNDGAKTQLFQKVSIAICAATAGVQVIEKAQFSQCGTLKIIADVNAVAPSGVEGIDIDSDGDLIKDTQITGFGALAIGQLKYKTQQQLLQKMLVSFNPIHIAYLEAFAVAQGLIE